MTAYFSPNFNPRSVIQTFVVCNIDSEMVLNNSFGMTMFASHQCRLSVWMLWDECSPICVVKAPCRYYVSFHDSTFNTTLQVMSLNLIIWFDQGLLAARKKNEEDYTSAVLPASICRRLLGSVHRCSSHEPRRRYHIVGTDLTANSMPNIFVGDFFKFFGSIKLHHFTKVEYVVVF